MENSKERSTGVIKWVNSIKGYGFIKADQNGADYFVHISECADDCDLFPDERVSFELAPGKDGKRAQAVKVRLIEYAKN